jgi:succinyl-CoA synthetase beta subunit
MILAEIEAENFLEKEGFPVAKKIMIETKEKLLGAARQLGFPCVLKISSSIATHKAAIGGVKIVYNYEDIEKNWKNFEDSAKKFNGKILLQKFVTGKELLVGIKKDPVFGHVLLVGIGGSFTEIIKDINFRIMDNVKESELENMLRELKNFKLIEKYNLSPVIKILMKTVQLSKKFPEIKELDINPLIINEKEAVVVDARLLK